MSEELEVMSGTEEDDFWETYQNFFLDDEAVEVDEELINLEVHSTGHDIISGIVTVLPAIGVASGYHAIASPEIRVYSEDIIVADHTSHATWGEEPTLAITVGVASAEHVVYSEMPEVSAGIVLTVAGADHIHEVDQITVQGYSNVVIDDAVHQIFDSGLNDIIIIYHYEVDAADCCHSTLCKDDLVIGGENDTAYPRDCEHAVAAEEVGAFTIGHLIQQVNSGIHLQTAENIDSLPMVYLATVDDSAHDVWSEKASPDYVYADSAVHAVTSKNVWSWLDNASHIVLSEHVPLSVNITVANSYIRFIDEPDIALIVGIAPEDCYHSLFTKDKIGVDNSSHVVVSDFAEPDTLYRRLYV